MFVVQIDNDSIRSVKFTTWTRGQYHWFKLAKKLNHKYQIFWNQIVLVINECCLNFKPWSFYSGKQQNSFFGKKSLSKKSGISLICQKIRTCGFLQKDLSWKSVVSPKLVTHATLEFKRTTNVNYQEYRGADHHEAVDGLALSDSISKVPSRRCHWPLLAVESKTKTTMIDQNKVTIKVGWADSKRIVCFDINAWILIW